MYTSFPGLAQVFGRFIDDGAGGEIAAAMAVNDKYGYVNASGGWVLEPALEYAFPFSEGLSHFCEGGLWGYRGRDGKVVVPARFTRVEPFRHGLAVVEVEGGKWRYIDRSGGFAFDASFTMAGSFSAVGLAPARGSSGKYGYIDRTGAWAIAPRFLMSLAFSDAGVAPAAETKRQYGLIDRQGKWVLEPCYESIREFNADTLAFYSESYDYAGYLDTNGLIVIRDMRSPSAHMQCGIAVDSNYICMTAQGKLEFDLPLDWCDDFNEHAFAVARSADGHSAPVWGIARADGTFAAPPAGAVEPITVRGRHIAPCEAGTALAAFLEHDRSVVLLDRDARVVYRLRTENGAQGTYAALYDAAGSQLWQGTPFPALRSPRRFFTAPPDSLLAELPGFDALTALAATLVQATEEKLHNAGALLDAIDNGTYASEAIYNNDHDDHEEEDDGLSPDDKVAQAVRSRRRIFRSYLDEDEHGRYSFLFEERIVMAQAVRARFVAILTAHYGPPERDPDYAGEAATDDATAWCIALAQALAGPESARPESNQLWLGLSSVLDTGDGDAWNHIWLVCAPSKETLEAALAGCAVEAPGDGDNPAPDDGIDWVARVSASPDAIIGMPGELIDDAIADALIESEIRAYPFLPPRLQTPARLEAQIRRNAKAASRIPPVVMSTDGLALARSLYADDARWLRADKRNSTIPTRLHRDCLEHVWGCLLDQQTCLTAVCNDADIRNVPWRLHNEDIVEIALSRDADNIRFIDPSAITPRVARFMACRGDATLLARIPPALLTEELCAQALLKDDNAFSGVPDELKEAVADRLIEGDADRASDGGSRWHALRAWNRLCAGDADGAIAAAQLAIGNTGRPVHMHYVLASAWRLKGDMQRAALEAAKVLSLRSDYTPQFGNNASIAWLRTLAQGAASAADDATLLRELATQPQMLAKIPGRRVTRAMVDLAVGLDADAVRSVPRRLMTPALYELALSHGHKRFEQLPVAMMSEAFCLAAVQRHDYELKFVPQELRTLAVCIASVRKHYWAIDHVPVALQGAVRAALTRT
ncbi:WG repeat-containing protein [Massilia violaceinigra]|uniref:WG repeat-containing protein n=1 Tax=Massilia violaceinigra TaxID=2045208 RepID=A0ABY4A6I3_9BURK|nr:WG repeat-containing protein [Massilia violaceinigra]UOD30283.1 WG repeat-containing protein [Massilia violaceinigra]